MSGQRRKGRRTGERGESKLTSQTRTANEGAKGSMQCHAMHKPLHKHKHKRHAQSCTTVVAAAQRASASCRSPAGVVRVGRGAERGGIGAVCRARDSQLLLPTCTCHWRKQLHPHLLKAGAHPCLQRLLPFAAVGVGHWLRARSLRGWSRLDVLADRCGLAKGKQGVWQKGLYMNIGKKNSNRQFRGAFVCFRSGPFRQL